MTPLPNRICFLIRRLGQGGAERQLLTLVRELSRSEWNIVILTFYGGGEFWTSFSSIPGVQVESLNKKGRLDVFPFLIRLIRRLRALKPDVVHGYLIGGNLFAAIAKPWLPSVRTLWGIRTSNPKSDVSSGWDRRLVWLERIASCQTDGIICNSKAGAEFYTSHGITREKIFVIPNGIDVGHFKPDPLARGETRHELGLHEYDLVVGFVGRLVPVKDIPTFLRGVQIYLQVNSRVRVLVIGSGESTYVRSLKSLALQLGLESHIQWLGSREDIHRIYPAMDLCVSTSQMEGFPNAIGEAMASGVPVACTDVGDCSWIVRGYGEIFPIGDPNAMAEAMRILVERLGNGLSTAVRERIMQEFSVEQLVRRTEAVIGHNKKILA